MKMKNKLAEQQMEEERFNWSISFSGKHDLCEAEKGR